jgi:thermitase
VTERLNRSALVDYAEPNFILRSTATPNDPLFPELYGMNNTGQTGGTADADIDAPEGWDAAGLGAFPASGGTTIGIVDTGIDQTHPELSGKVVGCADGRGGMVVEGECFDDGLHGTHVAGTIAAKANNATGVAGVDSGASLVICKALRGGPGVGLTSDVANCINWTHTHGAKVISMSLGGGASMTLELAVRNAWENGSATGSVLRGGCRQRRRLDGQLPGGLRPGGLRRGDRLEREPSRARQRPRRLASSVRERIPSFA